MQSEKTTDTERLSRLGNLTKKYKIAKGESDIRGWDVVTSDRRRVGKVHDLIVDTGAMKVRYLEIEVDRKILGTKTDSRVLVPIAGASLDGDDARVYIDDVTSDKLTALPPYDGRTITRDYETMLLGLFRSIDATPTAGATPAAAAAATAATDADFYDGPDFADRQFWAKRRAGREDAPYIEPGENESVEDLGTRPGRP